MNDGDVDADLCGTKLEEGIDWLIVLLSLALLRYLPKNYEQTSPALLTEESFIQSPN